MDIKDFSIDFAPAKTDNVLPTTVANQIFFEGAGTENTLNGSSLSRTILPITDASRILETPLSVK